MTMSGFLSKFKTVLHAVEAAAKFSAPYVAIADPSIASLMTLANNAAIGAEATITAPGSGAQKEALVLGQVGTAVTLINAIRSETGAAPLPANITDQVMAQTKVTIAGLNAVAANTPALPAA